MKDKLRELAGEMRNELCSDFAQKLEAILDAEGDGGAVACGYLITWNDPTYRGRQTLSFDRCSPDDGSFEPVYTHPARSGVVRDEEVEAAWDALRQRDVWPEEWNINDMRAALEHFAKEERHER